MTHNGAAFGEKIGLLRSQLQDLTAQRHLRVLTREEAARVGRASPAMPSPSRLWFSVAGSGAAILLFIFGGYEVVERTLLADASPELIYALHIARGMGSAVVLGTWAFLVATRTRRHYAHQLKARVDSLEAEVSERTAELERSRAFTEHLFESLRDHIVVTDGAGQIVKVNRVARESVPSPCQTPCEVGLCDQDCRLPYDPGRLQRDPRTNRIFEVERYPVPRREGSDQLVLEVARDVTDAKRLEALVVHQERMASLGVLAAGIAHDIGNPLASLSSELEMLELEEDPDRLGDSLTVLREHVDRIGRALREMVDFARRREDEGEATLAVSTAIDDALRLVRHDKRMRNVELAVEVEPGLPAVRMVEDHLVLVIVNLVLNALDAMSGTGTLRVSVACVDGEVRIRVSDSGRGMGPDTVERAFEPLFTTKGDHGGTGLGLSVSQSVVRAAGGRMEIDSEPGRGAAVTVWLLAGGADG